MRARFLRSFLILMAFSGLALFPACQGADEADLPKGAQPEGAETAAQPTPGQDEHLPKGAPVIDDPVEKLGPLNEDSIAKLGSGASPNEGQPILDEKILELSSTVTTSPGAIPRLKLHYQHMLVELPLEHTHVRAEISGPVARVEVTQSYQNPFDEAIETLYVFPLPENSAVDAMRMEIGDRVVEAEIQRRAQARKTYEAAKSQGFTAALLEQERPNIFTQSVANIAPNSRIKIVTRYVQDLTYDAGQYEFVFPMVVGPRYIPQQSGDGMEELAKTYDGQDAPIFVKDPALVGDASRITPPILGAGTRSGHDISIEIAADPGLPVHEIRVPTHEVAYELKEDGRFELMLAEIESIPNRDFVMRYKVAGEEPAATIMTTRDPAVDEHGYFTLMVQPPELDVDALVGQREFIFVVDISGSMRGQPLAMCKDAMRLILTQLRPVDTFNIISFESRDAQIFPASRPANDTNIKEGLAFVDAMRAGGGTELGSAIEAALGAEPEGERHRYVFFMTDARIGNEAQLLSMSQELLKRYEAKAQKARVFTFGVGRSVNHYLLEKLAQAGDGVPIYSTLKEDPAQAVNRFFQLVDHSVLEHLSLDWGALEVDEVYPAELPDLFASRPLTIHGRYAKGGAGVVQIKGYHQGEPVEINLELTLPEVDEDDQAQGTLWARAKIDSLERELWSGANAQVVEAITELGLAHRIVTPYTSFVAVDRSVKVSEGQPMKVVQPSEAMEGQAEEESAAPRPPSSEMESLLGTKMKAEGYDAVDAWGEFDTKAKTTTHGNYDLAMDGPGPGGSGVSEGSVGLGGFGTMGGGSGSGRSYGKGQAKVVKREVAQPKLKAGRPSVSGSLDKRIIRKVVNQHKRELRSCYEKEVVKDPTLKGKITVKWSIDTLGNVANAAIASDTMNSAEVSSCIVKSVKGWRFPSPKGGGLVVVSYPFLFEVGSGGSPSLSTGSVSYGAVGGNAIPTDPSLSGGSRTLESVQTTLAEENDDLIGCGKLYTDLPESGGFTLKWTLSAEGYVLKAELSAVDKGFEDYAACLQGRVESWRFQEAEGEDTVVEWRHEVPSP